MGGQRVGIRSSTRDLDTIVRRIFAAHVVDEPSDAAYSLAGPPASPESGGRFGFLYKGHTPVARARSTGRLLHALIHQLAGLTAPTATSHLDVFGVALVGGPDAVLVPERLRASLLQQTTRLQRQGVVLADHTCVRIDVECQELELHRPTQLNVNWGALPSPDRRDRPAGDGRHRLLGWLYDGGDAPTRASRVAQALRVVRDGEGAGTQATLEAVSAAVDRLPVVQPAKDGGVTEVVLRLIAR